MHAYIQLIRHPFAFSPGVQIVQAGGPVSNPKHGREEALLRKEEAPSHSSSSRAIAGRPNSLELAERP